MLRWRTEQVEEVTVLVIEGEIDMTSAPSSATSWTGWIAVARSSWI
ncbi:MAG: hypothetical protein QN122_10765 [Armatimonadota bacterium]|nr:hypothetical protein [Armatimonadota bacterium]MDR7448638.1 hypothetical protein [Armatimonadota bacterium]MDR7459378.1 hypothetical protein [Armatimonadota bacterium]MDR7478573.1 hypothetical protein [Armatimonadota bacterium]MDR7488101.1 hypothetical protein [Armatimonadota bacterium]